MKEKYLKPQAEIEKFGNTEILTTSSGNDIDPADNDIEWGT